MTGVTDRSDLSGYSWLSASKFRLVEVRPICSEATVSVKLPLVRCITGQQVVARSGTVPARRNVIDPDTVGGLLPPFWPLPGMKMSYVARESRALPTNYLGTRDSLGFPGPRHLKQYPAGSWRSSHSSICPIRWGAAKSQVKPRRIACTAPRSTPPEHGNPKEVR